MAIGATGFSFLGIAKEVAKGTAVAAADYIKATSFDGDDTVDMCDGPWVETGGTPDVRVPFGERPSSYRVRQSGKPLRADRGRGKGEPRGGSGSRAIGRDRAGGRGSEPRGRRTGRRRQRRRA